MNILHTLRIFVTLSLAFLAALSVAEAAEQTSDVTSPPATIESNRPNYFVGQRFWAATMDIPLLDVQVVLPGPALKTNERMTMSSLEIIPITTMGIQYNSITLSANYFANTNFSTSDTPHTTVGRKEWDVALGYAVLPNLTASISYKSATVDRSASSNAQALLGLNSLGYKIDAWLIGLSANAPLQDSLSLYGNMAYGIAKQKVDGGQDSSLTMTFNGNYSIGEIGLSYRLIGATNSGFLKNLNAQLGYRVQSVNMRNVPFNTISIPFGDVIDTQKENIRATTSGFVIGVFAAF
jgi:hypothetical protein